MSTLGDIQKLITLSEGLNPDDLVRRHEDGHRTLRSLGLVVGEPHRRSDGSVQTNFASPRIGTGWIRSRGKGTHKVFIHTGATGLIHTHRNTGEGAHSSALEAAIHRMVKQA